MKWMLSLEARTEDHAWLYCTKSSDDCSISSMPECRRRDAHVRQHHLQA
ncbi:hypothetical protein DAI22_07g057350 [Oryza sativa Japonica Group]|nr:hypothetical protein DAI22_07g057350 [Oryza sativa Japonica Group]